MCLSFLPEPEVEGSPERFGMGDVSLAIAVHRRTPCRSGGAVLHAQGTLHSPEAGVRTAYGVGEGSGGIHGAAHIYARCQPASDGEHRPHPPGNPGRVETLLEAVRRLAKMNGDPVLPTETRCTRSRHSLSFASIRILCSCSFHSSLTLSFTPCG